jgi:hypothetical protein
MQEKTPEELNLSLKNDPNYVINMIIDNNPIEVRKRMVRLEFGGFDEDITTNEDMIEVINYLLKNDKIPELKYVLSVPLISEKIPTIYYQAIEDASNEAYLRLREKGIYAGDRPNPVIQEYGINI